MRPEYYARSPKAYKRGAGRTREMIRAYRSGELAKDDFVLMLFAQLNVDSETQGVIGEMAEKLTQALELIESEGIECP